MSEDAGKLVLIDSFGLIYRAFFALPPLTNSQGQQTNAVLGFTTMLQRIITEEKPTYLVAAFDRGRPAARLEKFPAYKAQRDAMPDELRSQIPLVRRVLEAFAIPIVELENEEADDIIATLARKNERDHEVTIITGDLDLLQLVDERTTIAVTKRGIGEIQRYDIAAVRERYGLDPSQLADYRGLKGDPSDNLAGVPGIGEKTASKLIAAAGSLDALLADPSLAGTEKLAQKLIEHADAARLCRDLSLANDQLDVDVPWDAARFAPPGVAALAALYREMEFKQLLAKLNPVEVASATAAADGAHEAVRAGVSGDYHDYGMPADEAGLLALHTALRELGSSSRLAFVRREEEIGIAWAAGAALSFALAALSDLRVRAAYLDLVTHVPEFVAHDAKALFADLRHAQTPRPSDVSEQTAVASKKSRSRAVKHAGQVGLFDAPSSAHDFAPENIGEVDGTVVDAAPPISYVRAIADDSMLAAYVLQSGKAYLQLPDAVSDILDLDVPARTSAWADGVWRVVVHGRQELARREQLALYVDIELPIATLLATMEANGIAIDTEELRALAIAIDADVERNRDEIYAMAGEEFNLASPQQLGRILFEKLAIPGGKRNKTGYATGVEVLAKLAAEYPIAARILEYREVAKLKNTYVDVLPTLLDRDGRLRTILNQTTTATGRLSSTNPNLQNIPVRGELGRRIRKAFVSGGSDRVFLAADYSQIELRLMAHLSEDEAMREAFRAGHDIHDETARRIFGLGAGQHADAEQRRIAKSVNFGLLYGMGSFGLAQRLGIPIDESRRLVETYFGQFPGVRGFLDRTVAFGREHGYVETIAGRRRYLPDLKSRDHLARAAAEREATNAPLQGGAADLVKIAMLRVAQATRDVDCKMLLQIHDEILLEVQVDDLRAVATSVRHAMREAMQLSVPLEVTIKTGRSWYEVAAYDDDAVVLPIAGGD